MLNLREKGELKERLLHPQTKISTLTHITAGILFGTIGAFVFAITMAIYAFNNPDLRETDLHCYASLVSDQPNFKLPSENLVASGINGPIYDFVFGQITPSSTTEEYQEIDISQVYLDFFK